MNGLRVAWIIKRLSFVKSESVIAQLILVQTMVLRMLKVFLLVKSKIEVPICNKSLKHKSSCQYL